MNKFIITKDSAALLIIDIQERLAAAMSQRDKVIGNTLHLVELAKLYNMPVFLTEQYPKGLGPTVDEIKEALPSYMPLEKVSFDCCRGQGFLGELKQAGRNKVIVTGMETHVCVLQTALGLLQEGYDVHIVADAVSSRTKENWKIGLEFMKSAGAVITGTETVLFQLLEAAGSEEFKAISRRIK